MLREGSDHIVIEPNFDVCDFGISYIDDATMGIGKNDLVLLGAKTGVGKTTLVSNIAKINAKKGKRVHLYPLEESFNSVEKRILFTEVANEYYKTNFEQKIYYKPFIRGHYNLLLKDYISKANAKLAKLKENLKTFYRADTKFGNKELKNQLENTLQETDLAIIDNLQYIDTDGFNQNKEFTDIIKMVRDSVLINNTPVIIVSQIRKGLAGKKSESLFLEAEEFLGASSIINTSTIIISASPYFPDSKESYLFPTIFHIAKDREAGNVKFYIGCHDFNLQKNEYDKKYSMSDIIKSKKEYEPFEDDYEKLPYWVGENYERKIHGIKWSDYNEKYNLFTKDNNRRN